MLLFLANFNICNCNSKVGQFRFFVPFDLIMESNVKMLFFMPSISISYIAAADCDYFWLYFFLSCFFGLSSFRVLFIVYSDLAPICDASSVVWLPLCIYVSI